MPTPRFTSFARQIRPAGTIDDAKMGSAITSEIVEVVRGSQIQIQGLFVPIVGKHQPQIGDWVYVEWRNNTPIAVLAYAAPRAKFAPPSGGPNPLIEELFLYPNTGSAPPEVYYRDATHVVNLKLRKLLGLPNNLPFYDDLIDVIWGDNDNVFVVQQGVETSSKFTFYVIELSRSKNIASGVRPSPVKLLSKITMSNLTTALTSITLNYTRTGENKWISEMGPACDPPASAAAVVVSLPDTATYTITINLTIKNILDGSLNIGGLVKLWVNGLEVDANNHVIVSFVLSFLAFDPKPPGVGVPSGTIFSYQYYDVNANVITVTNPTLVRPLITRGITEDHALIIDATLGTIVYTTLSSSIILTINEESDLYLGDNPHPGGPPPPMPWGRIACLTYAFGATPLNSWLIPFEGAYSEPNIGFPTLNIGNIGIGGMTQADSDLFELIPPSYLPDKATWYSIASTPVTRTGGSFSATALAFEGNVQWDATLDTLYVKYEHGIRPISLSHKEGKNKDERLWLSVTRQTAASSGISQIPQGGAFLRLNGVISTVQALTNGVDDGGSFFVDADTRPIPLSAAPHHILWFRKSDKAVFITDVDKGITTQVGTNPLVFIMPNPNQEIVLPLFVFLKPDFLYDSANTKAQSSAFEHFILFQENKAITLNQTQVGFPLKDGIMGELGKLRSLSKELVSTLVGSKIKDQDLSDIGLSLFYRQLGISFHAINDRTSVPANRFRST